MGSYFSLYKHSLVTLAILLRTCLPPCTLAMCQMSHEDICGRNDEESTFRIFLSEILLLLPIDISTFANL